MSAWGGISSVQFALPLMWTESKRRGFTLQDIIRLMSVGPAKLARLENRKGKIEVRLELVTKELNHFEVIADLFRQIGSHSSRFVLFCSF